MIRYRSLIVSMNILSVCTLLDGICPCAQQYTYVYIRLEHPYPYDCSVSLIILIKGLVVAPSDTNNIGFEAFGSHLYVNIKVSW